MSWDTIGSVILLSALVWLVARMWSYGNGTDDNDDDGGSDQNGGMISFT